MKKGQEEEEEEEEGEGEKGMEEGEGGMEEKRRKRNMLRNGRPRRDIWRRRR